TSGRSRVSQRRGGLERGERAIRDFPCSPRGCELLPIGARSRGIQRDVGPSERGPVDLPEARFRDLARDATSGRGVGRGGVHHAVRRRRAMRRRGEQGQALVESSILLATLLGGLAVGGVWLMKTHPQMLRAIDAHVRGYLFALSLPFPSSHPGGK